MRSRHWTLLITLALVLVTASTSFGYVGPAGIGALGMLLAVVAVLLIGAVGLVLYPVRLILRHRRRQREQRSGGDAAAEPDSAKARQDAPPGKT